MPKRTDIQKILIIGSGPIIIGQACEFDYSGTQAIKALKEDGYEVVLINSNPATIMTDPEFADKTYIEPITKDFVTAVIEKERPDALLPTMGGQTALNIAIELEEAGVLEEYQCELIGASVEAIKTAEDRELFRIAMDEIGLSSAKSGIARSIKDADAIAEELGFPLILRPSRTLGGTGGGVARDLTSLKRMVSVALSSSPNGEVLIEKSLIGWKEMELEVMRDAQDNVVIICGIENIDPMGVHTGDSITVAPIQTLTDKEYQTLRNAAIKIIRRIGVDTGGSNVQFALNPENGDIVVIEMNPRVSRSSALASKATGFPIAKIAARLAVGYSLDEIANDITQETPACFEPSIDYVVVKMPRFNFEKFPFASKELGTQMKSVGEAMSFGRSFQEAVQKALYSLEKDCYGFDSTDAVASLGSSELHHLCATPGPERLLYLAESLRRGSTPETLYRLTGVDRWFLHEIAEIVSCEHTLSNRTLESYTAEEIHELKARGFSDHRLASLLSVTEDEFRAFRKNLGVEPSYKSVDTCAAEFLAHTPYLYSSYDVESEASPSSEKKVIILGSGPNRIGQGIEFDYCCVHAVMALREDGYEAIMVNCNPETVSTDYDISNRLYFEPLTYESVMNIVEREKPEGVIVQFGGQTPLKLAERLQNAGVPIIGTSVDSIDLAEDRSRFTEVVKKLSLRQPECATVTSVEDAVVAAETIGYPLMIRPSFVLGGRAMRVIHRQAELEQYFEEGIEVSHERPVLLDRFLHNAIEVDVDCVSDGEDVVIAGVMEHIERAGVHSGDSSCCLPPASLDEEVVAELKRQTKLLAKEFKVIGLMNVQFAVPHSKDVYILEVNPRASRTIPFVSKAQGIPWAKIAARVMTGKTLKEQGIQEAAPLDYYSVKACVFPFNRFDGVDTILGPEMKSTGEVMGIHDEVAGAFAKSQFAAGVALEGCDTAFLSVNDRDKQVLLPLVKNLAELGIKLIATSGTASYLEKEGIEVTRVNKVREGSPHVVDLLGQGEIQLVINTPEGSDTLLDSRSIRLVANELKVPTYTTIAAAEVMSKAMKIIRKRGVLAVKALQDYHAEKK